MTLGNKAGLLVHVHSSSSASWSATAVFPGGPALHVDLLNIHSRIAVNIHFQRWLIGILFSQNR